MRKYLYIIAVLSLFASCAVPQAYKYVEIADVENYSGKILRQEINAKSISSIEDSLAYIEAFRLFCNTMYANKDKDKYESSPNIIDFRLYNAKNIEISKTIEFTTKDSTELAIFGELFDDKYFEDMVKNSDDIQVGPVIDSVKIKELSKSFIIKSDEFSNSQEKHYKPNSAPKFVNQNGLYLYFSTKGGLPTYLILKLQYLSDEWLFIKSVSFSIDGVAYDYTPITVERDNGNGQIWEWFNGLMTASDLKLLTALSEAKEAKMKLIGNQYYKVKVITKEQISSIKESLDLYKAMGGTFMK